MNDLYRGYEIEPHANGGFYWTDERGHVHLGNPDKLATATGMVGYATADAAMDSIDAYRRALRDATA